MIAEPVPVGLDVVVLAGGRGLRMGGANKAEVRLDGIRLIDWLAARLPEHARLTVVCPEPIVLPRHPVGGRRVTEDPPFGGPVAGIRAGLRPRGEAAKLTAVLAVDAPESSGLVGDLARALRPGYAVAAAERAGGGVEPLCALWRTAWLVRAVEGLPARGAAARELFRGLAVARVPARGLSRDFDTVAELARLGEVSLPGRMV